MITRHPAFPPAPTWPWIAFALASWCLAVAWVSASIPESIPPQRYEGRASLASDSIDGRYGRWGLIDTELGILLASFPRDTSLQKGSIVLVAGDVRGEPGERMAIPFRARIAVDDITTLDERTALPVELGHKLRNRVVERLSPLEGGRALLAGFLIGDTSGVGDADVEAMRRSGLSHFVAVSGSNVALYLGLLFVLAGPLGLDPKRRAVVGLIGLPIYAAATRFEPSVMRASVMAGFALAGRLVGVVFEAWQLLSLAVTGLLLLNPHLVSSVGFQLSVAATVGVLIGARWPVEGRVRRALTVTVGAQLAVAPLILLHFGSIPLLSPLANLVAGPIVGTATLLGAIGVAVAEPVLPVAAFLAEAVLAVSRGAAAWPQVGPGALVGITLLGALARSRPSLRPALAVGVCGLVVLALLAPSNRVPEAGVVVLDVGQGDSILIHGGGGRYALVDGGPDPTLLIDRLRSYGVDRLDLVVVTHVHADHITGVTELIGRVAIDLVWAALEPHSTTGSERLLQRLDAWGVPVIDPPVGRSIPLGALTIHVEGPVRRYASPNDQSIVLLVEGPERNMLLAGDIETFAQADLGPIRAEVLKVPHQGAATSDAGWLSAVGADLAVISVGPNDFGHPARWVVDLLAESGAVVVRTDERGDVVVPLS